MERRTLISVASLLLGLAGCGDEESSSGGASCRAVCERIEAADCRRSAPDCEAACREDHEETPAKCAGKLDALSACFAKARFECDADGYPEAQGCVDELDDWLECRAKNMDDRDGRDDDEPDGGTGGNDEIGLSCEPGDACDTCAGDSCCDELEACTGDCQAVLSCVAGCSSESCVEDCLEQDAAAARLAFALTNCIESSCSNECSSSDDEPNQPTDADVDISELCLPGSIPDGYCDVAGKPVGHDCPNGKPYPDCVLSPTGAANVYCCSQ